jgi:hypothetical protein
MQPGERVIVTAHGGVKLSRVISQLIGNTVVVTKHEEWERAKKEGRRPIGVGFPKWAVKPTRPRKSVKV